MKSNISEKFLIFIIIFSCLGEYMSLNIHLPNMPEMVKNLHTTHFMVQLIFILSFITSWISQLIWGQISDHYGRRNIAIFSMLIALFGQFGCIIAPSIKALLIFRCVQYLFVGGMWSALTGTIVDKFKNEEKIAKILSIIDLLFPLVITIAPIIGAFIGSYVGWRGNFVFLFFLQSLAFILILIYLPETLSTQSKLNLKIALNNYKTIFSNSKIIIINICLTFLYIPFYIFDSHSSYIFIEYYKFSKQTFSLYQTIPMLIYFLATWCYIKILNKIQINTAIKVGVFFLLIFIFCVFFIEIKLINLSPLKYTLIISLMSLSNAFLRPSLESKIYTIYPEHSATVNGVTIFVSSLITGPTSICSAKTFDGTPYSTIIWFLFVSITSAIFFFIYKRFLSN